MMFPRSLAAHADRRTREYLRKERIVPRSIRINERSIIAKSAFAASDGESRPKLRGDKKFLDFHPAASPLCRCHNFSGTADRDNMDGDDVVTVLDLDAVIG